MLKAKNETTEQLSNHCKRCGRTLKNNQSKIHGFGPTCYRRYITELTIKPLFDTSKLPHKKQE